MTSSLVGSEMCIRDRSSPRSMTMFPASSSTSKGLLAAAHFLTWRPQAAGRGVPSEALVLQKASAFVGSGGCP
eukprot:3389295-Prorocentrum_lima.AAC.1